MSFIPLLIKANLLLHGVFFIMSGVLGFINAEAKLARIGLQASSFEGMAAFKVIYGGLMAAIGVIFLLGLVFKSMEKFSLLAIAIVMTALIVSRVASMLMDNASSNTHSVYMAIEIGELAITVTLLYFSSLHAGR